MFKMNVHNPVLLSFLQEVADDCIETGQAQEVEGQALPLLMLNTLSED